MGVYGFLPILLETGLGGRWDLLRFCGRAPTALRLVLPLSMGSMDTWSLHHFGQR